MSRAPVYFLSHGGPNLMYDVDHPAYKKLQEIGKEITTRVKPKAVVVISAHWEADTEGTVEVNAKEVTDLIYDFYGFPKQYFQESYPSVGSKAIASKILNLLSSNNIPARPAARGLDHGVWVPFKVAFSPKANPLTVPLIQVSLFSNPNPHAHFALGRALSPLRDEGICIITSGMAVHNLRELFFAMEKPRPMPYALSFDEALREAVTSAPGEREGKMAGLLKRADARQAHPTFEHLMPIFVGEGAGRDDVAERLWTLPEASVSWAMYRFGEVEGAA